VIAPPPFIYIGALAIGFGLDVLLPSASVPDWLAWPAGSVLLVAGGALAGSFILAFRRASTPVDPYRATTALVITGPYSLSRNPGYLGMALTYAGICLLAGRRGP
jgi:protein-S-isoprenylcysteine O-methyltransferase Ste14